ncbi:CHASE2 domain-containing protein [Dyella silvatica]|uniref:CHASE2 domain-containing protein n=1 Tax=Dyella silvatica TaxID=2992128 RepID=UPI00224F850B|nr:CHASE2 domain-containing protein [Dyella silvatica]
MRFDPFHLLTRCLIWLAGSGLLTVLLATGIGTPIDNALYDWHLRHWRYAPSDDVVIVAIDAKSLTELGRWPWPRMLHARLIDRLTAAGVRGIGVDITVAEPNTTHPENDLALAQAIKRNGRVVMPIFAEPTALGGPLEEMMPAPAIMASGAALGHVDVAEDADGLVRSAYLKAGLGRPYWPSFALAIYQTGNHQANLANQPDPLPGLRNDKLSESPYLWIRDNYVLLRYAGPAGRFGRISYTDVLNDRVPAALLKDRWVLIGATSEGLGDAINTPASRNTPMMPGVEYQANVLESLLRGLTITPLSFASQLLLGSLMLALPVLLQGMPGLRRPWLAALIHTCMVLLLSLFLLRGADRWWPPSACLLLLLTGYGMLGLFASWQRLAPATLDPSLVRRHAAAPRITDIS